jgi:hypothetical protein
MKKLFFIFIFLSTTFFTNQVAKSMETRLEQLQTIDIDSRFRCILINYGTKGPMYFLKYTINSNGDKFSPLTKSSQLDNTTLMLIFKPNNQATDVMCSLENTAGPQITTSSYSTTLKDCSFYGNDFKKLEIILNLIKTSMSAYFRQFIPNFKTCIICKEKIKDHEAAILLEYGHAIHDACYKDETKETLGFIISEDAFWTQIVALS